MIPVLIGMAVLGLIGAAVSSSEDDERKKKEQDIEEETREINAENRRKRKQAKAELKMREEQAKKEQLELYAYQHAQPLIDEYGLSNISAEQVADLAIYNPDGTYYQLNEAYLSSSARKDLQRQVDALEKELHQIDQLKEILTV